MNAKPISENSGLNLGFLTHAQGCSKYAGTIIGIMFMLAGIGVGVFFAYMANTWYTARSWPSTTCKILTSEIEVHNGDDGNTYSPEFTFELEVDGKKFVGDKYIPFKFSSSRKRAKNALADHPIGSEQTCYYNPEDPSDAVLNRDLSWFMFLIPLFPLAFFAIGCGVFISSLRAKPVQQGPLSKRKSQWAGLSKQQKG